jgi:formamidopyrimidine-DNA glycosylase
MTNQNQVQAIDILGIVPQNSSNKSAHSFESVSSYSHAGNDECPVCKGKMVTAKLGTEHVYFCPTHRISFPVKDSM